MNKMNRPRRDTKMGTAKRGFRSLAVAVTVPVSLTLAAVCLSGSGRFYWALRKPFWLPPLWALHIVSLSSSSFMGLSAWLVWAEGGFHRHAAALPLYLSQIGLGLLWEPVALGMGATRAGLAIGLALLGALLGCSRIFGEVNPLAGDLAKLCLGWAAVLALVNLTLIFSTSQLSSLNE